MVGAEERFRAGGRLSENKEVSLSVDTNTSSSSSATSSASSATSPGGSTTGTTPQLSATQKNLENLLVQYAGSESRDVQDMLARVASQLGVNINDVRAAATADAKAKTDAEAAQKATTAAADAATAKAASVAKKQHQKVESRRAAEEYRRQRVNNWWPSYASRA